MFSNGLHAEELDRILISVYRISLVNLYHRNIVEKAIKLETRTALFTAII